MNLLIITGGSSGIGHAIAQRFANDGWQVLNLSRRPSSAANVNLICDLSVPDAVTHFAPEIFAQASIAKRICLVHNAAVLHFDRADALPTERLRDVLELNIIAANALNQIVIPLMETESSLIYIGSTLAEKAVPGVASYVIAKHALVGMMRATCQDLAGRGIHTCILCPGFTDTPQVQAMIEKNPETRAAITALSAFDRLIEPVEIATAVAFIAKNPIFNGAVIHANLGQREH